jgi:hypothetical protein
MVEAGGLWGDYVSAIQKGTWLQVTTSERKRHSRLSLIGWRHCQHCAGVFAFVLVSSPMLCLCLPNCDAATHRRHRAGVLAGAALASLQAPRWHHCWRLLASPSASRWRLCPCCAGIIALGMPASVYLQHHLQHVVVHCVIVKSVPLQGQQ